MKCTECGEIYSNTRVRCPFCGYKKNAKIERKKEFKTRKRHKLIKEVTNTYLFSGAVNALLAGLKSRMIYFGTSFGIRYSILLFGLFYKANLIDLKRNILDWN